MEKQSTKARGDLGEEMATRFLRSLGFEIVETRYRHGRAEIDIIAREGDVLVFCEVKVRFSDTYGEPEYAVHRRKQTQIRRAAEGYLFEHGIEEQTCRFDVVAIRQDGANRVIRFYRNAF
jgi:putative endonuclease